MQVTVTGTIKVIGGKGEEVEVVVVVVSVVPVVAIEVQFPLASKDEPEGHSQVKPVPGDTTSTHKAPTEAQLESAQPSISTQIPRSAENSVPSTQEHV